MFRAYSVNQEEHPMSETFSTTVPKLPHKVEARDGAAGAVEHVVDGHVVATIGPAGLTRIPIAVGAAALGLPADPANPKLVKMA
jgi:hypothetical protein